jgi:hypothetical protein
LLECIHIVYVPSSVVSEKQVEEVQMMQWPSSRVRIMQSISS